MVWGSDHTLRIAPLRELASLRSNHVAYRHVDMGAPQTNLALNPTGVQQLVDYAGESVEICLTIDRQQALHQLVGFVLCADATGNGLPLIFRPETGTIRLGNAEAPFAIISLAADKDLEVRI